MEEVFLQLRSDDSFGYQPNQGAITSTQSSPFHRYEGSNVVHVLYPVLLFRDTSTKRLCSV